MGLDRFDPEDHNPLQWDGMMVARATGEYYRVADVDALLARIRAAVEIEREETRCCNCPCMAECPTVRARAALDALLAGGETVHQCPPDGSSITPCCGRIPFDLIGDRMATDPSLVTCTGRGSR